MIFSVNVQKENYLLISLIYNLYYFCIDYRYLPISRIFKFNIGAFKVVSSRVNILLDKFDYDIGNTIKEELSFAYIRAISSICAFNCDRPSRDNKALDFTISPMKQLEGTCLKDPEIKVQIKSTSKDILKKDYLHYPLEIKYYNRFCNADEYPPFILVVYLVNPNREEWLSHNVDWMKISKTAYWYSFRGLKEITDKSQNSKTTLQIPKKNIFSPDTLESMMMLVANGGYLENGSI